MKQSLLNTLVAVLAVVLFSNYVPDIIDHVEPKPPGLQTNITVLSTDVGLAPMVEMWTEEVQRRYHDAIIIDGHGDTQYIDGEPVWCLYSSVNTTGVPIKDVIADIRKHEPFRRIVILCCNPDGLILEGVPNVSYALANVWVVPDKEINVVQNTARDAWYGNGTGDIFEFVEQ